MGKCVFCSDETMIDESQKRPSLCVDQAEALNATNRNFGKISRKSQQKPNGLCLGMGHRQLVRVQGSMDSTH